MPAQVQRDVAGILFNATSDATLHVEGGQLFEQYKLYVRTHEVISERREGANKFFVTLNTAVAGGIGLWKSDTPQPGLVVLACLAALILCAYWYRSVRAYGQLNAGKFKIIHLIESRLPLALQEAEWEALGRGDDPGLYTPVTKLERAVPLVFAAFYLTIGLWALSELLGPGMAATQLQ